MAIHSSTLALKIPWMEKLGAVYYPWGRKESGTIERLHFHFLSYLNTLYSYIIYCRTWKRHKKDLNHL